MMQPAISRSLPTISLAAFAAARGGMSADARRFLAKLRQVEQCWEWQGARTNGAVEYGQFYAEGRLHTAHRWAYEQFVGPIPPEHEADHLCRYGLCCNPFHVEPVTPAENRARANRANPWRAKMTHCKRGHPLSGDNLWINSEGRRVCRTCKNDRQRAMRARRTVA